jgi:hypothetical protein
MKIDQCVREDGWRGRAAHEVCREIHCDSRRKVCCGQPRVVKIISLTLQFCAEPAAPAAAAAAVAAADVGLQHMVTRRYNKIWVEHKKAMMKGGGRSAAAKMFIARMESKQWIREWV